MHVNHSLVTEKIGPLKLVTSEFNLITKIDLNTIVEQSNNLENYIKKLDTVCAKLVELSEQDFCGMIVDQFTYIFNEITAKNLIFRTMKPNKYKRGLFDGIGSISKWLIGTMDAKDAEYLNKEINSLTNLTYTNRKLINQQTAIIQKSLIEISKHDNQITNRISQIQNVTNSLINKIESLAALNYLVINETKLNPLRNNFLELSQFSSLILFEFQHMLDFYNDVILHVRDSKLHPMVLSPNELLKELIELRDFFPKTATTIFSLNPENIVRIYEHIKLHAYLIQNKIIFKITVPLTNSDHFILHKLTPVPYSIHDNFYNTVEIEHEYLAISDLKYLLLKKNDLSDCDFLEPINYLCPKNYITYIVQSKNSCELSLFLNNQNAKCSFKSIEVSSDLWIPLHTKNNWIFVCPKPIPLFINCDNFTNQMTLEKFGLLQFTLNNTDSCKITTNNIVLYKYQSISKDVEIKFSQPITITKNIEKWEQIKNMFNEKSYKTYTNFTLFKNSIDKLNFNEMEEELQKINTGNKKDNYFNVHDIHHYTITYSLLAVFIFSIIIYFIRNKYFKKNTKDNREDEHQVPINQPIYN